MYINLCILTWNTYSLMQSGMDTYSIGTNSARWFKLKTNLIF